MYYQNVNGLRSKLSLLKQSIATCVYDILVMVETNLVPDIGDSELGLNDFSVFRCDRSSANNAKESGGGVLIAVNSSLQCHQLVTGVLDVECVFVLIRSNKASIVVGAVYIPPNMSNYRYERFCDAVFEVTASNPTISDILILGDFNQPSTAWDNLPHCSPNSSSQMIIDMANILHLHQQNKVKNYRGVILDLIFSTSLDTEVHSAMESIVPYDVNHPPLAFSVDLLQRGANVILPSTYNLKRCDVDAVFTWIQGLSYPATPVPNAEDHFTSFCKTLADVIKYNSPPKSKSKATFPKWFSHELKQLVIQKKSIHRLYKETGETYFYDEFKRLRTLCKRMAGECYRTYTEFLESTIPNNIKVFWSHIKNLKSSTLPSHMFFNNNSADEPNLQCELFAEYFASVYVYRTTATPSFDYGTNVNMHHLSVTASQVENKLRALDPFKGMGPDFLPPAIIKFCSSVLAPHLAIYFNSLLAIGTFPACLKEGYVSPIYKSGNRADISNYRPIVIQSVLAKVFESLILDVLEFRLGHVIINEQHGFRRGKSTSTNLILLQNYINSAFSSRRQVDCILLDFSKAFDRVNHGILLAKLEGYGISGSLLMLIRSYLTDRRFTVRFAGTYSKYFTATSGVPQGSHLAPFLFNLFINDIYYSINSKFLMFADDIKIFLEVTTVEDCLRLQGTLDSIMEWCKLNEMDLNVGKCAVLTYSRNSRLIPFNYNLHNITLNRVTKFKDLGVIMSSNLSPGDHIDYICAKANSLLGFLFRTSKDFYSPKTLITLFKTLVRPVLEYSSVVWCPYQLNHIDSLERLQTRVIRLAGMKLGFQYLEVPVDALRDSLGLHHLAMRRKMADLLLLHKLINGGADCPELLELVEFRIPGTTRSHDIFYKRSMPSLYIQYSFIPRLIREGNKVATMVDFFGTSPAAFKNKLKSSLFS